MRDTAGRIADSSAMIPIRPDGSSAWGDQHFDTARNWVLIEELLRDPSIQVQWIFVAHFIERMLLEHATETGVSETLRERAAAVMKEPSKSSPHKEHFHVRIYCSLEERIENTTKN